MYNAIIIIIIFVISQIPRATIYLTRKIHTIEIN